MSLDEIKSLIYKGNHSKAHKLIKNFKKKNKLSLKQKILLSQYYRDMNLLEESLKVLGPEDLIYHDGEDLKLFFELNIQRGRSLEYLNCKYYANSIFNTLENLANEKDYNLIDEFESWTYIKAWNLFKLQKFADSFNLVQQSILKSNNPKSLFSLYFTKAAIEFEIDKMDEAVKSMSIASDFALKAGLDSKRTSALNRIAHYYLSSGLKDEGKDVLDQIKLKDEVSSIEKDLFNLNFGIYHYLNNNNKEAISYFSQSKFAQYIYIKIASYYYLDSISTITISEKIALLNHPTYDNYSFRAGRFYDSNKDNKIPKHFITNENNFLDSWILYDGKIKAINYQNFMKSNTDHSNIDLVSGTIGSNQISENIWSILYYIICGGSVGTYKWLLIDKVYHNTYKHLEQAENKLKQAIITIKKLGFNIIIKNNCVFWKYDPKLSLIIPMHFRDTGPERKIKAICPDFTIEDIMKHYSVKKSTAAKRFKDWKIQ